MLYYNVIPGRIFDRKFCSLSRKIQRYSPATTFWDILHTVRHTQAYMYVPKTREHNPCNEVGRINTVAWFTRVWFLRCRCVRLGGRLNSAVYLFCLVQFPTFTWQIKALIRTTDAMLHVTQYGAISSSEIWICFVSCFDCVFCLNW